MHTAPMETFVVKDRHMPRGQNKKTMIMMNTFLKGTI
jgi:hypothetical protein